MTTPSTEKDPVHTRRIGPPLPEKLADKIAEMIASGVLKSGDRVVETALAKKLDVSRVPMREALKVLGAQGILIGAAQRGYRVAVFDDRMGKQVMEVRLALEVFLLRDAMENWRSRTESMQPIERTLAALDRAAQTGNKRASLRADLEFHREICRCSRNTLVSALWEGIARSVQIIVQLERYYVPDLTETARQHRAFVEHLKALMTEGFDEEILRKALVQHHHVMPMMKISDSIVDA